MVASRQALAFELCLFALFLPVAYGKKEDAPPRSSEHARDQAAPSEAKPATVSSPDEPPPTSSALVLPVNIDRHTGDLDEILKRRNLRALVLPNPIGFFCDQGQPRGLMYEAPQDFRLSPTRSSTRAH
jgi:hypothetical protein